MASPRLPSPERILPAMEEIVRSGHLTKGPQLDLFEKETVDYVGVSHAVGVSSCTSGLMLCLQALSRRLSPDVPRRVAVPSFTFLASVTALKWAGFEPVFVDVDPRSMNLCLEDLKTVLRDERLAAVLPVHCFGNPLPVDELEGLCAEHQVRLIFDAAHGFGSIYRGRKVGRGGWCQVFSLTPTKMVVAGEGGMICTDDGELAEELRVGREYGNDGSYDTRFSGLNARLSELHCCLGRASLTMLEEVVTHRNEMAQSLREALSRIPGIGFQSITPQSRTTYKDFTIVIHPEKFGVDRDLLVRALQAEGIPTRTYFSPPCHLHRAFRQETQRKLPQTEWLARRCLSLPLLEKNTIEPIVAAFSKIHAHARHFSAAPA